MNRMYHFNRQNSLVNLSNCILEHYHLPHTHAGIPAIVKKMEPYKKIAFLLFDGLGTSLLQKHLPSDSFLRKHVYMEIDSVFPPTTVAATNAFLSGLYPKENGWLGWFQYFPAIDKFLNVFSNFETYLQKPSPLPDPMLTIGKYKSVFDQVSESIPSTKVKIVFPAFRPDGARNLEEWLTMINDHLINNNEALIYGYWDNPDHLAHDFGVNSIQVKSYIQELNSILESFCLAHPDTLFLIFADHSLVDVEFLNIDEHQDFFDILIRPFAIEPRTATFFVKPDQKELFERLFAKYYGSYFDLFTHQEVIARKLFGEGSSNAEFSNFIGDYLAVAIDKYCFDYCDPTVDQGGTKMIGAHAGGMKEETKISLMII